MKTKTITNKFYRFCLYLTLLLCCNILVIAVLTIENRSNIISGIYQNIVFVCTMILLSVALSIFLVWIYPKIVSESHSGVWIPVALFAAILILQALYLFFVSHPMQTADAATVQNQSLSMLRSQRGRLDMRNAYFQDYTNNHFIVVFMYYFYNVLRHLSISQIGVAMILFNVLCLDFGMFLSYLSVRRIKNRIVANYFLILCLICPTTYVWTTYAYTNTFSMPFVAAVLYFYLCIKDKGISRKTAFLCALWGICAVIGYLIRPTTILPVIAIVLFDMVKYFRFRKETMFKVGIALVVCLVTIFSCQKIQERHISSHYEDKAFPITHWIMMGLKDDGGFNLEDRLFTESFPTIEERKEANIREIKKRLVDLGPSGYLMLLEKKLERVWGKGADDAFHKAQYMQEYPPLYEYFWGSKNTWFMMYMQAFRVVTFFFICLSILRQLRKKKCPDLFLYTLTLLGAITFFLLWEANPKYNLCFLYVCLLLMTDGVEGVHKKLSVWKESHLRWKKHFARGCAVIATVSIFLAGIFTQVVFAEKNRPQIKKVYYPGKHDAQSVEEVCDTPWVQEQVIQEGQDLEENKWNRLRLYFKVHEQRSVHRKEYRVEILSNPGKKVLYHTVIGMDDLEGDGSFCIPYEPADSGNVENYSVRITHLGSQFNFWTSVMKYPVLDTYPYGCLYINGEKTKYDLCFQLSGEEGTKRPHHYRSKSKYYGIENQRK